MILDSAVLRRHVTGAGAMKKTMAAIYLKSIAESRDTSTSLMGRLEHKDWKARECF